MSVRAPKKSSTPRGPFHPGTGAGVGAGRGQQRAHAEQIDWNRERVPHRRARVRVVTGSSARDSPAVRGSTHVFEQGSNVGRHQQDPRAVRRCQLPRHGSSSQVGPGLARRTSEVEKRGEGGGRSVGGRERGGGGRVVGQQTQAGECVLENCSQGWDCVRGGRGKATRLGHISVAHLPGSRAALGAPSAVAS